MIYLKIFEDFDSGFKVWNPRTNNNKFLVEKAKIFSKEEINSIKEVLKGNISNLNTYHLSSISFYMDYKDIKSSKKHITIEKFNDEWFLLTDYPTFYECDQLDGLLRCLKNLLPKSINESNQSEYYKKLSQNEFDDILTNPVIQSLSSSDIDRLEKFAKENNSRLDLRNASVYIYQPHEGWFIYDGWGLDKYISDSHIKVDGKDHYSGDYSLEDGIIVEDFTAIIKCDFIDYDINIIKCDDDWFLVCWESNGNDLMYKCDQIDGVIKFLKDEYEIHKTV